MKKFKTALSVVLCTVMVLSSLVVFADEPSADNSAVNTAVKVIMDGKQLTFDVDPIIENGRTLVPFRVIFEKLGCEVDYNKDAAGQHITATKEGYNLSFDVGSLEMKVNDKTVTLDVGSKILNGRTLVPLRAVSEAFACNVGWNSKQRTVYINTTGNFIKSQPTCKITGSEIEDGMYDVNLDPSTITVNEKGEKTIKVEFFAYDTYDIVDVSKMNVGDLIEYAGDVYYVSSKEQKDSIIDINGGFGEAEYGITLYTEEDTNGWRTLTWDDYPQYYSAGAPQTLVISDKLVLKDAYGLSDPKAEPVTVEYKDFEDYMKNTHSENWSVGNTQITVEKNRIVEIERRWVP